MNELTGLFLPKIQTSGSSALKDTWMYQGVNLGGWGGGHRYELFELKANVWSVQGGAQRVPVFAVSKCFHFTDMLCGECVDLSAVFGLR